MVTEIENECIDYIVCVGGIDFKYVQVTNYYNTFYLDYNVLNVVTACKKETKQLILFPG